MSEGDLSINKNSKLEREIGRIWKPIDLIHIKSLKNGLLGIYSLVMKSNYNPKVDQV